MSIMVDRAQFIDTLNSKGNIDYVLTDYVCVEHNHTPDEINVLLNLLNATNLTDWFISNMLDYYKRALTVCSVQKANPNYHEQSILGMDIIPKWITLYYF